MEFAELVPEGLAVRDGMNALRQPVFESQHCWFFARDPLPMIAPISAAITVFTATVTASISTSVVIPAVSREEAA